MILAFATLIGSAVPGRADDQPADATAKTGAITGQVVDVQGHPVAGAAVWGVFYSGKAVPTQSGKDGRFRLTGFQPDKPVTIWAEMPGLSRERFDNVHIFAGKDREIGRLALLPGTRIIGRAVDSQGKPAANATVKLDLYRHVLGHTISSQQTEWVLSRQRRPLRHAPAPRRQSPLFCRCTRQGPHVRREDR